MLEKEELKAAQLYINNLDLTFLQTQLTQRDIDKWSRKDAIIGIQQYKNYLYLIKKYNDKYPIIPPSKHIDEVWHQHILNTKKYHDACWQIFGHFHHHTPGEKTKKSIAFYNQLFDQITQELYFKEFGEYL